MLPISTEKLVKVLYFSQTEEKMEKIIWKNPGLYHNRTGFKATQPTF